jgi:cbb3-type cytochrome oxidase maturation protein
MSVIFVVIPLAILMAVAGVLAFIWASRAGQFDDLATPALRILHDDPPSRPDQKQ